MASATAVGVTCPKCDGPMWDNRETKKNTRAPDYKCKNRGCDGVIWPDKKAVIEKAAKGDRRGYERERLGTAGDESHPEWLRDVPETERRELAEMVGEIPSANETTARQHAREAYGLAQFQSLRISLEVLAPLYKKHGIELPADVAHKHAFELMKFWDSRGLIA